MQWIPILNRVLQWFTCVAADYDKLLDGLVDGRCACANAAGRKPRHLFVLGGGVAEIFLSEPGRNAMV